MRGLSRDVSDPLGTKLDFVLFCNSPTTC
ncbi:hypothetical protein OIU79_018755 [Salix purpurea]|uniref:Uncharacterized protein n=1 Tax=Salix purpurea TaxID=77065 RepID=A0A9Q0WYY6_SALPP|nr:hypothetical protein OIU79_018755 [Salix purpurea]